MNRADRYRARRERNLDLHARRGPIKPGDVALTVLLLAVAALVLPVVTTFGGVAVMTSAVCTTDACGSAVTLAVWLGLGLPFAIFVAGVALSVVRLFRHLRGWWVAAGIIVAELLCLPLTWGVAAVAAGL